MDIFLPPLIYEGPNANNVNPDFVINGKATFGKDKGPVEPQKGWKKRQSAVNEASDNVTVVTTKRKRPQMNWWTTTNSTQERFTATYVCAQPNYFGPHYVNTREGKFCDMGNKALYDLCKEGAKANCFDTATETLYGEAPTLDTRANGAEVEIGKEAPAMLKLSGFRDMNHVDPNYANF
jgi:hypothetical protein